MTVKAEHEALLDPTTAAVATHLYAAAARQTPRLIAHYLPKVPAMLRGRALHFTTEQMTGFYEDKYLPLEPAQAAFCYLQARALGARRVVEFGTSFGISTLWLAAAVRDNGGGEVISAELVPEKARQARQHVAEAGLSGIVDIRTGDALATLKDVEGPIDLFLNDGFPNLALELLTMIAPHMRLGAAVITDNVGQFRGNYVEYIAWLANPANGFVSTMVPFKSGTLLSVRSDPIRSGAT